jgi:antitoxin component YwqK of YwqJK toxin-antitoxin module
MSSKLYKSSIPKGCAERVVREYHAETENIPEDIAGSASYKEAELILNNEVVGFRIYNGDNVLIKETPLKGGIKHGIEYFFYDSGQLELVEPYAEGKMHGTACQYSEDGRLMGTYSMEHGTGYDIWRHECMEEDSNPDDVYVAEIHSMKDGLPHGFEWWLNENQRSVDVETIWYMGKLHGITRVWNHEGKLSRGFPKYYINDSKVNKKTYLKGCEKDPTLQIFKPEDNSPFRKFPKEIEKILAL